jgi:hypothetical protein
MLKNDTTMITHYKPNYFTINKNILLFFDIFYKDNKIYLIMPIYNTAVNSDHIHISVNNKFLQLTETHIKDSNEPILIYIYNYTSPANTIIKVKVKFMNRLIKSYDLTHIHTRVNISNMSISNNSNNSNNSNFLALTTLFKDDYYLFPVFYNYYKKQGVQHFYMYYNSVVTPEIKTIFDKPDVTLIEWGFHYWNPIEIKYRHHAQMGQMHHALYRYGKDMYEYMIFCDLDEYLHIPSKYFTDKDKKEENLKTKTKTKTKKIANFIKNNPTIDIFGFRNYWANTINDRIPTLTTTEFPQKFLAVKEPVEYLERSKNIYKVSSVNTMGIHQIGYTFYSELTAITDLEMYHFYKWSLRKRNINIEDCIHEVNLSSM